MTQQLSQKLFPLNRPRQIVKQKLHFTDTGILSKCLCLLIFPLFAMVMTGRAQIITTFAGNGSDGYSGDGGPATAASITPRNVGADSYGNVYNVDGDNNRIEKVDVSGIIRQFAGTGTSGYSGDGGAATAAQLNYPACVTADGAGNIYIADFGNNCIRKVDVSGNISTYAGNGTDGYSGDGGAATAAELSAPVSVAADASGNIYIGELGNNCIRKVDVSGNITTFAGNRGTGYSGDGGPATAASFTPDYIAVQGGNLLITDETEHVIRKINAFGIITTIAGTGSGGYSGDGGAATAAMFYFPTGIAVDGSGNVYIGDQLNSRVRKIGPSGTITTFAGNGAFSFAGDGGPATAAEFGGVIGVAMSGGYLYIADDGNRRIRKVNLPGPFPSAACIPSPADPSGSCASGISFSSLYLAGSTGAINDVSSCNGTGYLDETALSCTFTPGGTYTVTVGTGPVSVYTQFWIDFNNNGIFESGESVGGGGAFSTSTDILITIPAGATAGTFRMRAELQQDGDGFVYPILDPCLQESNHGEARDYTVNIQAPPACSGTPVPSTATISPATGDVSTSFSLGLSGTSWVSGLNYQWQSSSTGSAGTFSNIAGATSAPYSFTGINANKWYQCIVTCPTYAPATSSTVSAAYTMATTHGGLNFDGINDRVDGMNANLPQGSADRSVEAWINVNPTGDFQDIFEWGNLSIRQSSGLALTSAGNLYYVGDGNDYDAGSAIVPYGEWTHVAFTLTGSTVNFYVNGELVETGNISTPNYTSGTEWSMGNTASTPVTREPFNGTMDEVSAWNRVLSASEIQSHMSCHLSGAETGLVAYYKFNQGFEGTDDPTATTLIDATTSASNGTLKNFGLTGIISNWVDGAPIPAGVITGPSVVFVGSAITLSDTASGGIWSTSNGNASVSAGTVTGVLGGAVTISYAVTGGCTSVATKVVNVIPLISEVSGSVCVGSTDSVWDNTAGGTWSISPALVATVSATGVVSGISAGIATVTYTIEGAFTTATVTVNALPTVGATGGSIAVCAGTTATLSGTGASSYTWTGGITNGVAFTPATGVNTYTVTGTTAGCSNTATTTITVNALPAVGATGGGIAICAGTTATLSGTGASSYSWTGGITNGIAFTPATGVNTYTVTGTAAGCTNTAATTITVNAIPTVGAAGGGAAICAGTTATLSGTGASSYSWTGGITNGVAFTPATGVNTYTVTGTTAGCSNTATAAITVNATSAGTITGASSVNVGSNITLTDAVSGGTWSASNGNATVAGGIVHGVTAGTVTISYSVSGSCGMASATKLVTVGTGTVTVTAITQASSFVCIGSTDAMWDATPGGTWSIAPASVATISATGLVYGVSTGTATITYTVGASSATAVVTVFPVPAAIAGSGSVCQGGGTTTLSDATPGGVWSSAIPATATIGSATGIVTGTNPGTVTMYYTLVAPGGCRSAMVVTVNPVPAVITGPVKVCTGLSIALSDAVAGGTWSTSGTHASVDGSGNVTGLTAGAASITYSTGTGCFRVAAITVNQNAAPISGTLSVCTGAKTFLSDVATPGLSWTSSTTSVATITASGAVTGVSTGTSAVTYTMANLCSATAVVTVNPTPTVTAILGASSVSYSGPGITLSDLTGGGYWTSSNTARLTVGSSTGHVTAIVSAGSANINYIVTNGFGCSNFATKVISTSPAPHGHGGSASTGIGGTVTIADETIGGEWSSSDNGIATVDGSGIATGIAPGTVNITHTVTNNDGSVSTTVTELMVSPQSLEIRLQPNPNKGTFTLNGSTGSNSDELVVIEVTDMLGQVVHRGKGRAMSGIISEQVTLNSNLANGMYILNLHAAGGSKVFHFVLEQ